MEKELYIKLEESGYEVKILTGESELKPDNDNVDVFVNFKNGDVYTATFFTLRNIETIFQRNKETGECGSGRYFYCTDMILVESLTPEIIFETVKNLIKEGELNEAFKFLGKTEPSF
jgi:hypothetical protein